MKKILLFVVFLFISEIPFFLLLEYNLVSDLPEGSIVVPLLLALLATFFYSRYKARKDEEEMEAVEVEDSASQGSYPSSFYDNNVDEQSLIREVVRLSDELKSVIVNDNYLYEGYISESGNVRISGRMFGEIRETIISMLRILKKACRQEAFLNLLRLASRTNGVFDDYYFNLKTLLVKDIIRCYHEMGYPSEAETLTPQGQALFVILKCWSDETEHFTYTYHNFFFDMDSVVREKYVKEVNKQIRVNSEEDIDATSNIGLDDFKTMLSLALYKDEITEYFRMLIFRICQLLAKLDGGVTEKEKTWLLQILRMQELLEEQYTDEYGIPLPSQGKKEWIAKAEVMLESVETRQDDDSDVFTKRANSSASFAELNELIGLGEAKRAIVSLSNYIRMKQKRDDMGLKSPNVSYHCVFTGNPGTGKTTVARILAGIYRDLGILSSGHLIETDRSGLVAEYVGQTAVKTNKIIDSALGGVLFIDEAYTLANRGTNDYGAEAIATLLKRMEDDRDRLVVILAGYTNEIEQFINSNPGLRSRFNRYIHFEDYTATELYEIFCLQVKKGEYTLTDEASQYLQEQLAAVVEEKPKDFGNARFVRNLFEKSIEAQANRLASMSDLSRDELTVITKEDILQV